MLDTPTKYALLRALTHWEAVTTASLEADPSGAQALASVPGLADGELIERPGPFHVGSSGVFPLGCRELVVSDTQGHRVLDIDGSCGITQAIPANPGPSDHPGRFHSPRGLFARDGNLYVADSANARIQIFRMPSLELRAIWESGLSEPSEVTGDTNGRVFVLDSASNRVRCFAVDGTPNAAWDASWAEAATTLGCTSPCSIAVHDESLLVSDSIANQVFEFGTDGSDIGALAVGGAVEPRVLAVGGDRLYVASAHDGSIWAFSFSAGAWLGALPSYRGPVTALAVDEDGTLYIKPGLDAEILTFSSGVSFVTNGTLSAGPLDAGLGSGWHRISVSGNVPEDTLVTALIYTADTALPEPQPSDFFPLPGIDALVPELGPSSEQPAHPPRFLWLRLELAGDGPTSPRLEQVQVETEGESYLDHLPLVYARRDESHTLRDFLELFRSVLGDVEWNLESVARRLEPSLASDSDLGWLCSWLAFEPPKGQSSVELRELMAKIPELYSKRGTRFGIEEFAQLYTGVRPHIFEPFAGRAIWRLGETSTLGIDTGLVPALPDGVVVPNARVLDTSNPRYGCGNDRIVVGQMVVGAVEPQPASAFGEPLFREDAHQFIVSVAHSDVPDPRTLDDLISVLDAEKPAHTQYHLCVTQAAMRVGVQAMVGVDSIVGGVGTPPGLVQAALGVESLLSDEAGEIRSGRVGSRSLVGRDTVLG